MEYLLKANEYLDMKEFMMEVQEKDFHDTQLKEAQKNKTLKKF